MHTVLSFHSIAVVSRDEKAQISMGKWNKKKRERRKNKAFVVTTGRLHLQCRLNKSKTVLIIIAIGVVLLSCYVLMGVETLRREQPRHCFLLFYLDKAYFGAFLCTL